MSASSKEAAQLASWPTRERIDALKRIVPRWKENKQARQRLRQEVETLSKLYNLGASVPAVYDSFLKYDAVEPFLIMEFIKGVRFDEWLKASTPIAPAKAVLVTNGIVKTINLCHENEIGHRDLKPSNIILKNGEINSPYVLDFGIAFDSRQTMILTQRGEIFRNEFINLPECQDLEGGHRDLRSDITALAGIFFTCLTGKPPIVLRDAQELAPHQRHERFLLNSADTPEQNERLIWFFDRAFSYRINERFQTLNEFSTELARFSESFSEDSLDLIEQFDILDRTIQSKDRNVQLLALRKKYTSVIKKVSQQMHKELKPLGPKHGRLSDSILMLAQIQEPNIPILDVGDLLNKGSMHSFKLQRDDFQKVAVVLIVAFGVGMQIHLYLASYCALSNKSNKPLTELKWSKIATIDENANVLSETKLSVIVKALNLKLAHETRNLVSGIK